MKKILVIAGMMPVLFCITMILAYFTENSMLDENEKTEYAFTIKGLHATPTKRLYINTGKEDLLFYRPFFLSERDSLRVGDSIYKGKGAEYLFIFRKNSEGDYKLYHRTKSELKPYDPDEVNPYFDIK